MLTAILILLAFSGLCLFGAWLVEGVKQMGIEEERLRRAEQDLNIKIKQAEIMAQDKSAEDVANDLDRGKF